MNKVFYPLMLLATSLAFAQTGKVGINTERPTETLQIQGTTRITDLPINTEGLITTKTDGTESTNKDQVFSATKTLVVDENGVVGAVRGLPVVELPEYKTVPFVSKSVLIGPATPLTSITKLGNLEVRFNGINPNGGEHPISFRIHEDAVLFDKNGNETKKDVVLVNTIKVGWGNLSGTQDYMVRDAKVGMDWKDIGYSRPNIYYNDFVQYMISFLNTKELYRVSAQVNAPTTHVDGDEVPARVTIFIEKLTNFE